MGYRGAAIAGCPQPDRRFPRQTRPRCPAVYAVYAKLNRSLKLKEFALWNTLVWPYARPFPRSIARRALEIIEAAQALEEGSGPLVFTHGGGRPLHDSQLRRLLRELGIAAVPHGFRSTFRDWAGEETDHPREVIEAALAHVVRNRVEAAYARSDLFERRRVLMDDWARYLAQGSEQDGSTISASEGQARGVK